jgi:hypothetical protein
MGGSWRSWTAVKRPSASSRGTLDFQHTPDARLLIFHARIDVSWQQCRAFVVCVSCWGAGSCGTCMCHLHWQSGLHRVASCSQLQVPVPRAACCGVTSVAAGRGGSQVARRRRRHAATAAVESPHRRCASTFQHCWPAGLMQQAYGLQGQWSICRSEPLPFVDTLRDLQAVVV